MTTHASTCLVPYANFATRGEGDAWRHLLVRQEGARGGGNTEEAWEVANLCAAFRLEQSDWMELVEH